MDFQRTESNSLVLFKSNVYPGDCHGYIWKMKTVLASSKKKDKKIVREKIFPTEPRVKNVVTKDHELKSQLC